MNQEKTSFKPTKRGRFQSAWASNGRYRVKEIPGPYVCEISISVELIA